MASTTPASSNLLDILQHYDIFKTICFNLEIGDLLAVRLISKTLSRNYSAHWKSRWDINRSLKRFVRDPKSLRSLMARTNATITGSFVIQFLDSVLWPTTALDILVPREGEIYNGNAPSLNQNFLEFTTSFGKHLCEMEGYKRIVNNEEGDGEFVVYPGPQPLSVEEFIRPQTETTPESRINIVLTLCSPVEHILYNCRTTQIMNFITWNRAYSIFPDVTFLSPRKQLKIQHGHYLPAEFIHKYEQRGWGVVDHVNPGYEPEKLPHSIYPTRRIGDSSCWMVALNTDGVEAAEIPDFVLELSYFDLNSIQYNQSWYRLFSMGFRHPALKYKYMRPDRRDNINLWRDFAIDKLENAVQAEIKKLDSEREGKGSLEDRTFYDHLLPGWHDEWCNIDNLSNGLSGLEFDKSSWGH